MGMSIRGMVVALALLLAGSAFAGAQELALSTNFVDYANSGTLNVEASYGVARHWSLDAGMKYNPFSFDEGEDMRMNKQRSYSAGARFWPWHIFSGWWMSAGLRYQEYNRGGYVSPVTSEGDRYGGGLGAGYTYMLSPHFNVELGAALWAGYDVYRTYSCQTCGNELENGGKYFILPGDIKLALSYIF